MLLLEIFIWPGAYSASAHPKSNPKQPLSRGGLTKREPAARRMPRCWLSWSGCRRRKPAGRASFGCWRDHLWRLWRWERPSGTGILPFGFCQCFFFMKQVTGWRCGFFTIATCACFSYRCLVLQSWDKTGTSRAGKKLWYRWPGRCQELLWGW